MQMQQMEEQIWNYIDGTASQKEVSFIEGMIAADMEWQKKYRELLEVNQLLKTDLELEQPSLRFSKNVMEQISSLQPARATVQYINKNIIRGIAAFFILTIAGLLVYSFTQMSWASTAGSSPLPFELINLNLDKFDFSKLMSSTWINVVLMVNVILGLLLLDSYLRRKKKSSVHNSVSH
ncbi:MAG: hypothetical protein ABL872_02935 [Lacibacter sp.]